MQLDFLRALAKHSDSRGNRTTDTIVILTPRGSSTNLDEKVNLLPFTLKEHYQSFMLPKNHPTFDLINVGLMKEIQKERWGDLQRKYDVKAK